MNLRSKNFWFFAFLTFFLIFLIYSALNLISSLKKISNQIEIKKSEIYLAQKKKEAFEEFTEILKREKENLEKIDSIFVKKEMPVEFINFLEKTAQDYNLSFQSSLSLQEKNSWPSLSFQLNLTGSFPEIVKFLRKLIYGPYLIEFQSLEISRIEKTETAEGPIKANISFKVFAK